MPICAKCGNLWMMAVPECELGPQWKCPRCAYPVPMWYHNHTIIGPLPSDDPLVAKPKCRKARARNVLLTCHICGKTFKAQVGNAKYCPKCLRTYNSDQRVRLSKGEEVLKYSSRRKGPGTARVA